VSLIWYLENVFYQTSGEMLQYIQKNIFKEQPIENSIINLGFWPGGDRDGNPFVTAKITLNVADRLRTSILKCYYSDIRKLKRKLTFSGIDTIIAELEHKLYRSVFYSNGKIFITLSELKAKLHEVKSICIEKHQSLYLDEINDLLNKINVFGFHFASLDVRQNSKIHKHVIQTIVNKLPIKYKDARTYEQLLETEKIEIVSGIEGYLPPDFSMMP